MVKFKIFIFLVIGLIGLINYSAYSHELVLAEKNISSPASEVESAVLTLNDVKDPYKKQYMRFFSTYALPADLQEDAAYSLSYVCHLLVGPPIDDFDNAGSYYPIAMKIDDEFVPIQRSKYSKTLYWIDIREFNWTEEVWEKLSNIDGYFVEPIVDHYSNSSLRLVAGNAIVRADWFIVHATDLTQESDQNIQTQIFYELLYARNKVPQNLDDWLKIWGVADINKSRTLGNEYGGLILNSGVSRHNRMLFGYRTELGWLYHTYDVKSQTGKRDYLDNFAANRGLPPKESDGGEGFAFNSLGMLTAYMIRDGNNKFVDFGDPTLVYHLQDVTGDPRVRTATSCLDCHSGGPIPPRNIVKEYVEKMSEIKVPKYSDKLRIERTFLSNKFEESVGDGQIHYERSLLKVNGLTPAENVKAYLNIVSWYKKPLDLNQVLVECGIERDDFFERLGKTDEIFGVDKVPTRLAFLITNNEKIPRDIWESPGRDGIPGTFQQTMISLYGITVVSETTVEVPLYYRANVSRCNIYHGSNVVHSANLNSRLEYLGQSSEDGKWLLIKYNNITGWVKKSEVIR
jgi:hypothetical protein